MGIAKHSHKLESEPEELIVTPSIMQGHKILDKFRFSSGNGLIRGIRTQQGTINVGHSGGVSSSSPSSPMTDPCLIENGKDYRCDVKGIRTLNPGNTAQQLDWASTDLGCVEFNITPSKIDGSSESYHTQAKVLVEEEGLHDSDEIAGDVTILTPSQCPSEPMPLANSHDGRTDIESSIVYSNIRYEDFDDEFFTVPDFVDPEISGQHHTTIPISIAALPKAYENPIQQSPQNLMIKNMHRKSLQYLVNSDDNISEEKYDDFDDEDVWREITKQNIGMGIQQRYAKVERQGKTKCIDEIKLGPQVNPTSLHCPGKLARTRGKSRLRAPLPPTLLNPLSRISNKNANSESSINTATKRMLIFPAGSPKLARMEEWLAILNSINKYTFSQPMEPSILEMVSEPRWAHLPVEERRKPFIRVAPSDPVSERSPVEGLNIRNMIRVCFRIGEAIRFTNMATPTETKILIELFARVKISERVGLKQNVQLDAGDVYHDHPPFLSGSFNLFRVCSLWDEDSANLVGEHGKGKLVRVVGQVKRVGPGQADGMTGHWMNILSIWECGWTEIERARGVVCGW